MVDDGKRVGGEREGGWDIHVYTYMNLRRTRLVKYVIACSREDCTGRLSILCVELPVNVPRDVGIAE